VSLRDSDFKGVVPVSPQFLSEVSGLELHVGVEEYQEGGENGYVHKFPGRMTWPHIVMKAGVTNSDALFQWVNKSSGAGFASSGNKITRCTGAITALGTDGKRLRAWELEGAFPVRWTGPRFSVGSNEALQEELEIAHHGFKSKTFSGS
jgi:phage tail-like protein